MMRLKAWDDLPNEMRCDAVKPYYLILRKKKISIVVKRLFDVTASFFMLALLSPLFVILAVAIKIDSPGPVFFRQERITQYGKRFKIFKFRTMVVNAEQIGLQVTINNDVRVTKVGKLIRKCRLDEISQLIDILRGTMSFVGTRPEVGKYVCRYTPEMLATLLLPAGVTSEASIRFKDEERLLVGVDDIEEVYINKVLPQKMAYNLWAIANFNFIRDLKTMVWTVLAVLKRERMAPTFEAEEALAKTISSIADEEKPMSH